MTNDSSSLIRISRRLGRDPRIVQGGGGNVSYKEQEGMWVKASGSALKDLAPKGFVQLDYIRLRTALHDGHLRDDDAYRRELAACRQGPGRPSIESALHALLGPTVIHTHPNAVLRLLCRKDARKRLLQLGPALGASFLFVPYVSPGLPLAEALLAEARRFGKDLAAAPLLVFLANHGLFVSAKSAKEAEALHARALALCEEACPRPPFPQVEGSPDAALRRRMRNWARERGEWRAPRRQALLSALPLLAQSSEKELAACFPDQVVYLGPAPLRLEGTRTDVWDRAWESYLARWRQAPLLVFHANAYLLFSYSGCTLNTAREESLASFCDVLCGQGRALSRLTPAECLHLMTWESERYRRAALADLGARKIPHKEE